MLTQPAQLTVMSEVKFACPVCGQHITCDASKSATHMACPTCYRELVVPHASAAPGKLVLTATEVQARPVAINPALAGAVPAAARNSPLPGVLLVAFLLTVGAAAFVFRERIFRPASLANSTNVPAPPEVATVPHPTLKLAPADADSRWTQNLAAVRIEDSPANGRVHGYSFAPDRATITGGALNLRQGSGWPADLSVTINLAAARSEDLAGKVITVASNRPVAPRITLRWKESPERVVTETLHGGYILRLEFGAVTNRTLAGRLYLATADAEKSFVSGAFRAEIRPPGPARNRGAP
jgi:hypothetical protein